MTVSIDMELMKVLSSFISEHMGLSFGEDRMEDLEKRITAAANEFRFSKTPDFIQWLISAPLSEPQIESLAGYLTVGETYFFREKRVYEILENHILPELVYQRHNTGRTIRIWSAGCATGEEPYSIAISLSKLLPTYADWNVTILGTDLNTRFLKTAENGIYSNWSFRGTGTWFRDRYFEEVENERFRLNRKTRNIVEFKYLNLARDSYPSLSNNTNAMDIIFVRNVLMYFRREIQETVIKKLYQCLMPGGYLITSQTETSYILFADFTSINFPDAIVYRKDLHAEKKSYIAPYIQQEPPKKNHHDHSSPVSLLFTTGCVSTPAANLDSTVDNTVAELEASGYDAAALLFEKGLYIEALETIFGYIKEHPDEPDSFILAARINANLGNLSQALGMCDRALAIDRTEPSFHYLKAIILQESGKIEEAMRELTTTLYLDQDHILGHFTLGNHMRTAGKQKRALKHFKNTIELLAGYEKDAVLDDADGLTAGRLAEIIDTVIERK